MKNSYDLEEQVDTKYHKILDYDKKEIDAPDKYQPWGFYYRDRLKTIIDIIRMAFPIPDKVKIGDFACAQGRESNFLSN